MIGDLVCELSFNGPVRSDCVYRFRKESHVQDLTTQKASKAP